MNDLGRVLQRTTGPLWRRIRLLLSRGTLRLVNDGTKLQEVQVALLGGNPAWAERFQQYGYTSHPLVGAEAIVVKVSGASAHPVALSVDDRRYRPKGLKPGEVCLYTDEGDEIRFKRGRVISVIAGSKVEVTAPEAVFNCSTSVTLNTPKVIATGDIEAAGQIRDGVGTMQGIRDTYNGHDHPGDSGGTTNAPNQGMG
ncbi:phage baseplate assembly protein V [Eoetvoesiella caeni]